MRCGRTSEEHAVAIECFFSEGEQHEWIEVPSCAEHNEANSKDVEYVRNVVDNLARH